MTSEIIWRPTPDVIERSRIGRFMRAHGVASLEALQRRSVTEPEWYWDAVVRDLGVRWSTPYRRVLDESRGIAWARWFEGGRLNFADNCVDRHVDAGRGGRPAIVWEGDDGQTRTLTYAELLGEVSRLAHALRRLGVGEGDRVGVFLPMSPEAAIATLAVVRIGAIYTPCFSGFGAQAVASRLQDSEAKLLITADGFHRRGQVVRMKETADEALAQCPTVTQVLVYRRLGREVPWSAGRDRWWDEAVAGQSDRCAAVPVEADRPCLIIYTSGTTGKPKGAVLTHGGFLLKAAHDFAYCHDVGEQDRLFWLTDLGWLMGPMAITAGLFHGGTAVLFEGVPDYP
ncbi:MAG TPA: AMP-binding protein, partial [Methylomirabilota bacterium]|nr:AMP-binding protein [Methylomirabilota bacterium]